MLREGQAGEEVGTMSAKRPISNQEVLERPKTVADAWDGNMMGNREAILSIG